MSNRGEMSLKDKKKKTFKISNINIQHKNCYKNELPKILYHFNIANGNDKLMLMKIANVLKYHNCNCNKYTQLIFMSNLSKSQHSSQ